MEHDDTTRFGVFFGNLEDEIQDDEIVPLLISLVIQTTGIVVLKTDIMLRHSAPCKCNTACIFLRDEELQRRTVEAVQKSSNIPKELVKEGRTLRVDYFQPNLKNQRSNPSPLSSPPEDYPPAFAGGSYLVRNQRLGNETRILEFKRGGGDYIKKYLRSHLAKYICSFLNSEGGALLIGVDDRGVVQGVICNHGSEDRLRVMVDNLIHYFDPPVLPEMYRLSFIPVRDSITDANTNLKVIKISVQAGRSNILYETPEGDVYIRRDGSIQGPLRAKDIQEWCHLKFGRDFEDRENILRVHIDNLKERLQNVEEEQRRQDKQSSSAVLPSVTPSASQTLVTSTGSESRNNLKRTNSKVCIIL